MNTNDLILLLIFVVGMTVIFVFNWAINRHPARDARFFSGRGIPSGYVGGDGDFYLDLETGMVWRKSRTIWRHSKKVDL